MKKIIVFMFFLFLTLPVFCKWEYKQKSVMDDFGDEIRKEDYYICGNWNEKYTDKFILFFLGDKSFSNGLLSFGDSGYKSPGSYTAKISIKEENNKVVSFSVKGETSSNWNYWNVLLSLDFDTVCQIIEVFDRNETVKVVVYFGKELEPYNYGSVSLDDFKSNVSCIKTGHKAQLITDGEASYNYICSTCGKETIEGAIGLAGGHVIYDKGFYSDGWRYLEAAPSDLHVVDGIPTIDSSTKGYSDASSNFIFGYYKPDTSGKYESRTGRFVNGTKYYNAENCTGRAIGDGKNNTELLVSAMKNEALYEQYISYANYEWRTTSYYAANLCDILISESDGVQFDDWFLPSRDELWLMGGVLASESSYFISYWSSSESDYPNTAYCIISGFHDTEERHKKCSVRPIRAF